MTNGHRQSPGRPDRQRSCRPLATVYLVLVASACGPASSGGGPDADAGDAAASDGAIATGGASASGGAPGSGGVTASGGASGATGTGSVIGSGGVAGTAGSGGTSSASGGTSSASGGTSATGGAGSGGQAGSGGMPIGGHNAGGSSGAGGASAPIGVVSAGVRWIGRVDLTNADRPRFSWSGSGFIARFTGTSLSVQLNSGNSLIYKTVVDDTPRAAFTVATGQQTVVLATGLTAGVHTVALYRQTEGTQGASQLLALTVGGGTLMDPPPPPARLIEIVGDSISAGYGNLGALADSECYSTESHWDTYGAVTARALNAEVNTIAISGQGAYRNYGGEMTDTAPTTYPRTLAGEATPTWSFGPQPQVVIINYGTNDISNNKGDPGTPFRTAYTSLLQLVRSKNPAARIICIIGPLLSGTELSTISGHIRNVVDARVAAGDKNLEFFDQIAAQTSDKAACQYHPNVAENKLMADQLVTLLKARLSW